MKLSRRGALLLFLVLAAAAPPPSAAQAAPDAATLQRRQQTFEQVWSRVKERHYDPKLGGMDWDAVRKRYRPQVDRAGSDAEFYALLNKMLGELKQSHFGVVPPDGYVAEGEAVGRALDGETGLTVQLVEDRAVVTRVEPDSPAARAGLRPGHLLTDIDGKALDALIRRIQARKLRTAEERAQVQFGVRAWLNGPVNSRVRVGYLDGNDDPRSAEIARVQPPGERVRFGELPPAYARWEARRLAGGIGYLHFNLFMMPVLAPIRREIGAMHDAPGIVLDLRGNVGGIGMMAASIASSFSARRGSLGTMKLRQGEMNFVIFPGPRPYTGPLVILTDETSLSTSEILAGGLQESRRAVILGRHTAGMILPSLVERLPGGAVLQYAVADFKTPKGILLEGRGVTPDISVPLTRRDLLLGRDPILEEGLAYIRSRAGGSALSAPRILVASGKPTAPKGRPAAAAAPKPGLSAEQVLARNIEATGGRATYARLTSMVLKGTIENRAQGLRGTLVAYAKAPDKILLVQTLPGVGETRQGFDGRTGWSEDPFFGLRTLQGTELASLRRASALQGVPNWQRLYKKVERIGTGTVEGSSAILLRLTPPVGKPVVNYYDARTFLLLRTDMVVESPQGSLPTQATFSDYRAVAGVKMPFVTRQRVAGVVEILITLTDVQSNVPVDDALFARPAAAPAALPPAAPSPPAPFPQGGKGAGGEG